MADTESKFRNLNAEIEKMKGALDAARAELSLAKTSGDARVADAQKISESEKDRLQQALDSASQSAAKSKEESAARITALEQQLLSGKSENGALASDLAFAKKELEAARLALAGTKEAATGASSALEQARNESDALRTQLVQSKKDSDSLSEKLAADEATLKAAGESSARVQSAAAELEQSKSDLAATRAQLADALKDAAAAKTEAASAAAAKGGTDRQVAELSEKLSAALATTSLLQDENNRLKRVSPLRPSAVAAASPAPAAPPAPVPVPAVREHTVVDGDTLTKISLRYYGTSGKWLAIYQANRDKLPNESTLTIGTVLRIP